MNIKHELTYVSIDYIKIKLSQTFLYEFGYILCTSCRNMHDNTTLLTT